MRIAIHAPRVSYYMGGAERYIINYTKELKNLGEDIYLITYDAPEKSEWFKEFKKKFKGKIILIKSKKIDLQFKKFQNATKPLLWDRESLLFGNESKYFYEKNHFDLIVLHYNVDCINIYKRDKLCLHLHGLPDKARKIERKAVKIPDKIIAVSNYVAEGWKKLYRINKKISIIYNGINLRKIKEINKKIDVLFFGRIIKIKGVDILIRSIKILKENIQNIKVKIIGNGPEREHLILLTKKLKLSQEIEFTGKISDQKLTKNISEAKISVFPSYAREGVMTTILEASLLGSGIIAANACSNKEFIKNNYNGLLFEPKNPSDLAKKIKKLLLNENLRMKLIKNSRQKLSNFSWNKQTKKILKVYQK
jgi:glycosyltransferase involved in cell wall biosynthesis